jgi:hypothetical protein
VSVCPFERSASSSTRIPPRRSRPSCVSIVRLKLPMWIPGLLGKIALPQ